MSATTDWSLERIRRGLRRRAKEARAWVGPLRPLYAKPRHVADDELCHWYHSMTLPRAGEVTGLWDLRGRVDEYIGNVDLRGKRVIEVGPASGFLTFEMEQRGADVVAIELPPGSSFDIVPFGHNDSAHVRADQGGMLRYMQNGFWRAYEELGSKAKVHYGDVLHLPDRIGNFDVALLASVLQHLHDPVGVVLAAAARTTDTIVVTDLDGTAFTGTDFKEPVLELFPSRERPTPFTWWLLRPQLFEVLLDVLGFTDVTTTYHDDLLVDEDRMARSFTVVGHRPKR